MDMVGSRVGIGVLRVFFVNTRGCRGLRVGLLGALRGFWVGFPPGDAVARGFLVGLYTRGFRVGFASPRGLRVGLALPRGLRVGIAGALRGFRLGFWVVTCWAKKR